MGWEDDVGTAGDVIVARRHGVSVDWVRVERERRGIPALGPMATRDWSKVEDLGKVPDKVIAKRLGVHYRTVATARSRLGIPGFGTDGGAP